MKLPDFYWDDYVNNWEIDYYNDLDHWQKEQLGVYLKIPSEYLNRIFYKKGEHWNIRVGGMTYMAISTKYYNIIKEHLDSRLKEFLRNKNLEELGI